MCPKTAISNIEANLEISKNIVLEYKEAADANYADATITVVAADPNGSL